MHEPRCRPIARDKRAIEVKRLVDESPEHSEQTVEKSKRLRNGTDLEIAPRLGHAQGRPHFLGAASGDAKVVKSVSADPSIVLAEIDGR